MTGFYESGLGGTLTPHDIEEHSDTDFGILATGDMIKYNAVTAKWETVQIDALITLGQVTDVNVVGATNGQVLQYNSGTGDWEPATLGGGGATELNGLTDVTLTTPSNGQVMVYNGSQWVNQAPTSGNLDGLTDVTITSVSNGDRIEWNGSAWVNVPSGSIGNPLVIGDGTNGTDAGLILDAGNTSGTDENYIEFQTNSVKRYSIQEGNSVAGHFLNFRDSTDTNIFSVTNGLFAIQQGTEFRLVNEDNATRHWIFQATNDGSGYNSLSISDSVGSNQSIDIAATVDITGSLTVSGNIGSPNFTTSGRLLEVGSFGVIQQSSIANTSLVLTSGTQTIGGLKTFSSQLATTSNMRITGNCTVNTTSAPTDSCELRVNGKAQFTYASGTGSDIVANVAGTLNTASSDQRLKDNIAPTQRSGLEAVLGLVVKEFDWKDSGKHDVGFIAQEGVEFIPEAFPISADDGYHGVRTLPLVATLWKAVQELSARVEELENGV